MARSIVEADAMIDAAAMPASCWPSARPSASIRRSPPRGRCSPIRASSKSIGSGTFPERSLDIDVVFDLMIHDLDVVLSIVDSDVESLEAVGVPVITQPRRHRQRAAAIRQRLHRQPHRQPHQPRSRPEDPVLPAVVVRVDRLRGAEGRALDRLVNGSGPIAVDSGRRHRGGREEPLKRELADFVDAIVAAPRADASPARPADAPSRWRRRSPIRWRGRATHDDHETRRTHEDRRFSSESCDVRLRESRPMYSDLTDFLADLDKRRLLARVDRAGEPRSRDRGGDRSRLQVAGRRTGAAVREAHRLRHSRVPQPVRIERAHVPRARREDARRPRERDRRADDAADARRASWTR